MRKENSQQNKACPQCLKHSFCRRGYTIIETMISVSLFLIVVTIGMNALLNANLVHRKSQDMRSIMDNLSFIMDDISRNLRTGYDYNSSGDDNISFTTPTVGNDIWIYDIGGTDGDDILRTIGGDTVQLNPQEIKIDQASSGFIVTGAEPPTSGDFEQPFVTIKLVGKIIYKGIETPFTLQTSVSQRLIDI